MMLSGFMLGIVVGAAVTALLAVIALHQPDEPDHPDVPESSQALRESSEQRVLGSTR